MDERSPAARLAAQAARLRVIHRALTAADRARILAALGEDPLDCAWRAILCGEHPFADWLASDSPWSALPETFDDGCSARQIVASHPLAGRRPWSSPRP